jgi:hypothetical protein
VGDERWIDKPLESTRVATDPNAGMIDGAVSFVVRIVQLVPSIIIQLVPSIECIQTWWFASGMWFGNREAVKDCSPG